MLCRTFSHLCLGMISFSHEANMLVAKCRELGPAPTALSWLPRELDPTAGEKQKKHEELVKQIWNDVEHIAARAHALKETDSAYSILQLLLSKGYYPPNLSSWNILSRYLLPFVDVEGHTVLQYPGGVESMSSTSSSSPVFASLYSEAFTRGAPIVRGSYLYASRQTLLMTGGVVPLSARCPSANGNVLSRWVKEYVNYVRNTYLSGVLGEGGMDAKSDIADKVVVSLPDSLPSHVVDFTLSVFEALAKNQRSIHLNGIADSVVSLLYLAWECCVHGALKNSLSPKGDDGTNKMESLFLKMVSCAQNATYHCIGPTLLLRFFAHLPFSCWTGEAPSIWGTLDNTSRQPLLSRWCQVQLDALLNVVRVVKYLHKDLEADLLPYVRSLERTLDRVFQYNANHDDFLRINSEKEPLYRLAICELLLSVMRDESVSPDRFLREAMEVVERCPPSMAIEAELLSAKVQLLEVFDLDKDGKTAVYKDLLISLRNLVDLRPRQSGDSIEDYPSSGVVDGSLADLMDGQLYHLDPASQLVMQRAHEEVITVFSESEDDIFLNEAYGIIISHKYHGLVITRSIIKPLLKAFARRGDGRVFNLVDLCVLYSNNTIDVEILGYLFQTCAVNGDYYRARTLLKLLEDSIPGFLLKATEDIKEHLRTLNILPFEDQHLFLSEEDIRISEALGRPPNPLRSLP